ncbi:tripartite tricarboxylate transporter substrate binding protein [Lampropedia puyangensis]|uniref:Tripartite tricarboxylate transporter substrate binding protein n=1 Tax=Lampropedia puyangensis TaxID=1330072 RepID=A0A4S8FB31_9BURK|nr:tripartite tricarboxylate transporter substrate binding protein [Lampropedia puyangensis]THU03724.1 tripartite tricarboxylate transporter substrate binding protein [Lampropedia puyangensis]
MLNQRHSLFSFARRQCCLAALGLAALTLSAAASANDRDDYPNRPVTVLVPYAPGGQGDVFARLLSEPLARRLGKAVVVDNRPGASGALGARLLAQAPADGYTLMLGQTGEVAINGFTMKKPGYDAVKDFRPVALVGNSPLVLVAPASAPFNTMEELIRYAKDNPGQVAYASSGTGTPGHLAAAALAMHTGTEMIHVPYRGAGQAINDVIGAQVHIFFSSASAILPHVKGGRIKAIAVGSKERLATLPDVPAVAETVPGFDFTLWGGYFAPRQTPEAVVQRLNQEINDILQTPDIRQRFIDEGSAVEPLSTQAFEAYVQQEATKYRVLIETTGIQVE